MVTTAFVFSRHDPSLLLLPPLPLSFPGLDTSFFSLLSTTTVIMSDLAPKADSLPLSPPFTFAARSLPLFSPPTRAGSILTGTGSIMSNDRLL